jgi:hypothetical protein
MHPQPRLLPFELQPINLPGAYTTPAPPADFDPRKASTAALIRQGMLWKRPHRGDSPSLHAAWDKIFARRWHPKDRIVPLLAPQPGKTHVLRGLAATADAGYTSANWSGAVMQGQWATVLGCWTIPKVNQAEESPGTEPGSTFCIWIGIDGFSSADILQAGIQHCAGPNGQAQYVAWCEWYAPEQPGSPPYIWQTNIPSFHVGPGQQIYCGVQYINHKTAGQVYFGNDTTGQHFSLTLLPPPGATLAGDSIAWITSVPGTGDLPHLTPIRFAPALGCCAHSQTIGNPQTGDPITIVRDGQPATSVSLAHDEVSICCGL